MTRPAAARIILFFMARRNSCVVLLCGDVQYSAVRSCVVPPFWPPSAPFLLHLMLPSPDTMLFILSSFYLWGPRMPAFGWEDKVFCTVQDNTTIGEVKRAD